MPKKGGLIGALQNIHVKMPRLHAIATSHVMAKVPISKTCQLGFVAKGGLRGPKKT